MGQSLTCVRRLQVFLVRILDLVLTYAQGIEQSTKRHRSGAFLYRRSGDVDVERAAQRDVRPVIHASKPGDENVPLQRAKAVITAKTKHVDKEKPTVRSTAATSETTAGTAAAAVGASRLSFPAKSPKKDSSEPRRFHLSRAPTPSPMAPTALLGRTNVDKRSRYTGPAVFVERSNKRKRVSTKVLAKHASHMATTAAHDIPAAAVPRNGDRDQKMVVDHGAKKELLIPQLPKRPGSTRRPSATAAAIKPSSSAAAKTTTTIPLPSSLVNNQWDADMDELAREMHEYTLQTMGQNLARMDAESKQEAEFAAATAAARKAAVTKSPRTMHFKPKAPAKRFAERHPELGQDGEAGPVADLGRRMGDIDMESGSDTDDEDYVIEMYVRVPGHELSDKLALEKVGLLVFDTEPDVDFFYGHESDSEPELEDDEDENGMWRPLAYICLSEGNAS